MVNIISYGAYVPIYRIPQAELVRAWGKGSASGEKAIAGADEDSITMAVEAVFDCLKGQDRKSVDALYFASTTPPYKEKQCASIVAAAADLREDNLFTIDITNSVRAGTSAMKLAMDAIESGSAEKVVVVASDNRIPAPGSEFEPTFASGAAAFLLSDSNDGVGIEGYYTVSAEFLDVWKMENDIFPKTWEGRFVREEGYEKIFPNVVRGLLEKYNFSLKNVTKAVYYAPDAGEYKRLARLLGLDSKQVQDPMFDRMGDTGCAYSLMLLVAALEETKKGDTILLGNYGDGGDAYLLKVNELIRDTNRRGIKKHLESKLIIENYEKYLSYRGLIGEAVSSPQSSASIIWRDRKQTYHFYGQKCRKCGGVQFPRQRVCIWCQAWDSFDDFWLADKKGRLYTYSMDERATVVDLPNVIAITEVEGTNYRFSSVVTDRDPKKIEVGMPVEFTFRKMHEGAGFINYYWKVRPVRT